MKKLCVLVVLLLCLLLCLPGCSGNTWVWDDDGAVGARLGTNVTENNEAGLSMLWRPDDSGPRVMGLYGVHHFPEPVEFRNPLILDFMPETLEGKPYIGGKFDVNFDTNETLIGPVAGIIFEDVLFLEYQFQSFGPGTTSASSKVLFGLRFEF